MTTKDDRALLEAAARAAGMELDYSIRPDGKAFYHSDRNAMALADGGWFAPLTDDGDALRLAVKLNLTLVSEPHECEVFCEGECLASETIYRGSMVATIAEATDPYAANRRAIVRAAASMAKERE